MHYEYRAVLRDAVSEWLETNNLSFGMPKVVVDDCQFPELGLLSTNVAFELSKLCRQARQENCEVDPQPIAQQLLDILQANDCFDLQLGGDGFINASPSQDFQLRYISALSESEEPLFPGSLIFNSNAPSAELNIDLSPAKLEKLCSRSKNKDVGEFLSSYGGGGYEFDTERLLVLLGLLADPEAGLSAYQQGLNGRENSPWYVERFRNDLSAYLKTLQDLLESEKSSTPSKYSVPQYFEPLLLSLITFRYRVFRGGEVCEPLRLFEALLDVIKKFYSFYNRPQSRAPLDNFSSSQLRILCCALKGLQLFTERGIRLIVRQN